MPPVVTSGVVDNAPRSDGANVHKMEPVLAFTATTAGGE